MNAQNKSRLLSWLVVGTSLLFMVALSWNKWADPSTDYGRELYIPWQLTQGKVLYKDIFFQFGPASKYFSALLFLVFGTHFSVLVIFQLFLILALCRLIYSIFLETSGILSAAATTCVFIFAFAFSQYNTNGSYNYVCPYSFELVHSVFLAFVAIFIFMHYQKRPKEKFEYALGFLAGLIFLGKSEVFIAILVTLFAGCLAMHVQGLISRSRFLKAILKIFIGWLVCVSLAILLLSFQMPILQAAQSVIAPLSYLADLRLAHTFYYQKIIGRFHLVENLRWFCWSLVADLAIFSFLAVTVIRLEGGEGKKKFSTTLFIFVSILFLWFMFNFNVLIDWIINGLFRPLPLFLMIITIFFRLSVKRSKDPVVIHKKLTLFVMSVFSLVLLVKMAFNVHVFHYGFVLAMPGALILSSFLLNEFPNEVLGENFNAQDWRKGALAIISFILAVHVAISFFYYHRKTQTLSNGSETLHVLKFGNWDQREIVMQQTLDYLRQNLSPKETVAVLPQGAILNYLSRRENPTPYVQLVLPELLLVGEDQALDAFKTKPPDYVIFSRPDSNDTSYGRFGRDYGVKLGKWIEAQYHEVQNFSSSKAIPQAQRFEIQILKLN